MWHISTTYNFEPASQLECFHVSRSPCWGLRSQTVFISPPGSTSLSTTHCHRLSRRFRRKVLSLNWWPKTNLTCSHRMPTAASHCTSTLCNNSNSCNHCYLHSDSSRFNRSINWNLPLAVSWFPGATARSNSAAVSRLRRRRSLSEPCARWDVTEMVASTQRAAAAALGERSCPVGRIRHRQALRRHRRRQVIAGQRLALKRTSIRIYGKCRCPCLVNKWIDECNDWMTMQTQALLSIYWHVPIWCRWRISQSFEKSELKFFV